MVQKMVGIKEFRQNLADYTDLVKKNNIQIIVLRKNVPVLKVESLDEKEFVLGKLSKEIKTARAQAKRGEVFTQKQMMEEFGLL